MAELQRGVHTLGTVLKYKCIEKFISYKGSVVFGEGEEFFWEFRIEKGGVTILKKEYVKLEEDGSTFIVNWNVHLADLTVCKHDRRFFNYVFYSVFAIEMKGKSKIKKMANLIDFTFDALGEGIYLLPVVLKEELQTFVDFYFPKEKIYTRQDFIT